MIDRLSALLGIDVRELAGANADLTIPLSTSFINRRIAEYLARSNGQLRAAVVEPHAGDNIIVHVRLRSGLVPPLQVHLHIEEQPALPDSPVLVLRWSLAGGMGALARMAVSPALGMLNVLPPGIRVDGELIGIDLAEIARSKDAGWALPLVKRLRVHTSEAGVSIEAGIRL